MQGVLGILQKHIDQLEITEENGVKVCTSMEVARCFGRAHSYVLYSIRRMRASEDFIEQNFHNRVKCRKILYSNQIERSPYYLCTLKGVMLLALIWVKDPSCRIKEDFVEEYFRMAEALRSAEDRLRKDTYKEIEELQIELANRQFSEIQQHD